MKKALYALLAIALVGGIAFGVSQSDLLKGSFPDVASTETSDGSGSDRDGDGTLGTDGTDTGTDGGGRDIPGGDWIPGGTLGLPDPDDEPSCDPEYYLDIYLESIGGVEIEGVRESKFTIATSSGTDVTGSFSLDTDKSTNGRYKFDYNGSGADTGTNYVVTANPGGFKEDSFSTTLNSTCSDVRTGYGVQMVYNHIIAVKDHEGNNVSTATVRTGTSYATSCDYWSSEQAYVCETPDSSTEQYRVSYEGYVTEQGSIFYSGSVDPDLGTGWASEVAEAFDSDAADRYDTWSTYNISWDYEDLFGIYTDPTWGMNDIATSFDYDQYIEPDYWNDGSVIQEEYYGTGSTDAIYTEAVDFYGSILSGTDLARFNSDAGYHDFMVNSYINAGIETAAYQAAIAESYNQGSLSYSAYNTAFVTSGYQYQYQNWSGLFRTSLFNVGKNSMTSLLAAVTDSVSSGAATYELDSVDTGTATTTGSFGSSSPTTFENYDGELEIDKTVTMNEFAWTVFVYDEAGNTITDANVQFDDGSTSNCDHIEYGQYWCSESSYYSSSGNAPEYTVSKSGYDTESGSFSSTRSSQTSSGVNEVVYLEKTDNTDPASYCSSITLSTSDLPVAYDANEVGTLTLDVLVKSTSEDYVDTFNITTDGVGNFGSASSASVAVDGEASTFTMYYYEGTVGDTITASVEGAYCDSVTLEVSQDDEPDPDPDTEEEYELACSAVDINPDSYEIWLTASSSTLHEFTLDWTVVEQLVAVRHAPEWIKAAFAYKNDLNPLLQLAEDGDGEITLTVGTTGNGDLYYSDDLSTGFNELTYKVYAAESDTVTFYYAKADGGDSLYVTSNDSNCSDSLTLTEEEEEDDDIDFEVIEDIDACDEYPFTDVDEDDDLATYIYCLAQTGAVQGYSDGTGRFGPSNQITNAELIKVIVSMTGQPLASSGDPTEFVDIDGHWAERYIKTAEALDIARPREGVYFNPDEAATRGYLVVLLARGAGETLWGWDENDINFTDVDGGDYYAYALILANNAEGDVPGIGEETIVEGYSDGSFRGYNNIRRDEAAAMLIRAFYAWYL